MTQEHTAKCCCGQLTATVRGKLPNASICHCYQCQKRTGNAYGLQARFAKDQVTVTGESTAFVRRGEGEVTMHFCPTCGSTLFWYLDGLPDSIIITVGAFTNPEFPAPTFSVYEDRQYPWVQLPDTITTHWD